MERSEPFADPGLLDSLHAMSEATLDAFDLGVIAFDADGRVRRYNATESRASGLLPKEVLERHLFTEVAQCMNNFMVAQRYADADAAAEPLDVTIDFVLTWRMKPTPVQLRLLSAPGIPLRYLVLRRRPS